MNKFDLADPEVTREWVDYFAEKGLEALPIDAVSGGQVKEIIPRSKKLLAEKINKQISKGINPRASGL